MAYTTHRLNALNRRLKDASDDCLLLTEQASMLRPLPNPSSVSKRVWQDPATTGLLAKHCSSLGGCFRHSSKQARHIRCRHAV